MDVPIRVTIEPMKIVHINDQGEKIHRSNKSEAVLRWRNRIESQCKPMKTITTHPNQSLVFVAFLAIAPGRKTSPHKKLERAYPRIPGKVARALALPGGKIAAHSASLPYLLFEYRMRIRWSRCAA